MKCCKCKKELFEAKDNKIKLRTNILVFEKSNSEEFNVAVIKCPICKADNKVPILLDLAEQEIQYLIFEK